jgi:hypothetical protein
MNSAIRKLLGVFLVLVILFSCKEEKNDKQVRAKLNALDSLGVHDSLEGYSCWINPEVDSVTRPKTIKLTFEIINDVPDTFNITDTTIGSKKGSGLLSYSLFNVGGVAKIGLKYGNVLIPKLNHSTQREVIESTLKAISKRDTIYELQLYSSKAGFFEMIKNDAPRTENERTEKEKIIWNSYIGVLHHGKFYENKGN